MPEPVPAVRLVSLGPEQAEAAALVLARAFQDDPLFAHACPDPDERARWLPWFMLAPVWRGLLVGEVLGTAGSLKGVAVVMPPGEDGADTEPIVAVIIAARAAYRPEQPATEVHAYDIYRTAVAAGFVPGDEALHKAEPGPAWYLFALGVDPAHQGHGIGSQLVDAVGVRADADRVPSVLFTLNPRNVEFYRRYGYRVVAEGTVAEAGPDWWAMRRSVSK